MRETICLAGKLDELASLPSSVPDGAVGQFLEGLFGCTSTAHADALLRRNPFPEHRARPHNEPHGTHDDRLHRRQELVKRSATTIARRSREPR
jgi:hypothetical protein